MKILSVEQIREADKYTILHEPIHSIDLMERAGTNCFNWLINNIDKSSNLLFFCGKGNNGGDGLVIARKMIEAGFQVSVFIIEITSKASEDFIKQYERIKLLTKVFSIDEKSNFPVINTQDIIIDAIFGSGLNKSIEGFVCELIEHINSSKGYVISIDIPSGLFADMDNTITKRGIIKANLTLTLQMPKLAFMFTENEQYIGDFQIIDIGLHPDFLRSVTTLNHFTILPEIAFQLKQRKKFSHKGTYGHALLIGGSMGKMGAVLLAGEACLRSGVGLLTAHIPGIGNQIMQIRIPEIMVNMDTSIEYVSQLPKIEHYNAIGIGPGLGTKAETQQCLKLLIQNSSIPLLMDADAINILAENKTWLAFLPVNSIITPHVKEFERLFGQTESAFERMKKQREEAMKNKIYIVLKGAHTSIATPDGEIYFNSSGNAGMATAGSGDVLTGIILSLLAQGYSSKQACLTGVFIHGLSGDYAQMKTSQEFMIAGDIIKMLKKSFKRLHSQTFSGI